MSTDIYSGGLITKDPNSSEVFSFNWNDDLAAGVSITTSTFTITSPNEALPLGLTKDNETHDARSSSLRLLGGTLGKKYVVTNRIVTDESPTQTKDASVTVSIANK